MEMLKWAEVVCSSRRSGGFWLLIGVFAGFSAVVFVLSLCARNTLRNVAKEDEEGLQWGWSTVKGNFLRVVRNGGAAESGGEELSKGPQQLYALIRSNSSFSETIRTGDVPAAAPKRKGSNQTVMPVWQRAILMGERCRLPDHSGLILYDVYGNPLPQSVMK